MRETLSQTEEELKQIHLRWKTINWFIVIACFALLGRLWHLQIIHGKKLKEYSEKNSLKEIKIPAPRGLILDRTQQALVHNQQDLILTLIPQYTHHLKETAEKISNIINIPSKNIREKVIAGIKKHGPFRPVSIKKHLTLKEVVLLKKAKWTHSGIHIQEKLIRHYPLKENGAHLFGYLSEITKNQIPKFNKKYGDKFHFRPGDIIGKAGLEMIWEYFLRGQNGFSFIEVNVHNQRSTPFNLLNKKPQKPIPGKNLILTIDKNIQKKTYSSFFRKDSRGTRHGVAIVMKTNGEILAWVSYPAYDPNIFSIGLSSKQWLALSKANSRPLRNKAIQDHYPPGSTFKPIVALAALQENLITPYSLVDSPKEITVGRKTYHDYRQTGHGTINLSTAIERSANVFFYKLGLQLKIDTMSQYARLFHLGQKTNIKLEKEITGLIPDSQWKKQYLNEIWQEGENLIHAIGQGFILTTPLQMTLAYNILATSGKIVKPFIVKQITDINNNVVQSFEPEIVSDISTHIDPKHFKTIQESLKQVVHGHQGTARFWKIPGVKIGGKTGTSQVLSFSKEDIYKKCQNRPHNQKHHGWFIAIAPIENPEIVVSVLTEHSCSGSGGSGPLVKDIIQYYFKNKNENNARS